MSLQEEIEVLLKKTEARILPNTKEGVIIKAGELLAKLEEMSFYLKK